MDFINELIQYYKSKYVVLLIVAAIGVVSLGFVAMLMFITFMTTKSILIARTIGIICFVILTTIPLWFHNWKFVSSMPSNTNTNKIKYYIIAQVLSTTPILIVSIVLSMLVSP